MKLQRRLRACLATSLALSLPIATVGVLVPNPGVSPLVQTVSAQSNDDLTTLIEAIELQEQGDRMTLAIALAGTGSPQVFFTQQGNEWVGDISNATLDLDLVDDDTFREENPVPGIRYIEAQQVDDANVQIRMVGEAAPPQGLLSQRDSEHLIFDFDRMPSGPVAATPSADTDSAEDTTPEMVDSGDDLAAGEGSNIGDDLPSVPVAATEVPAPVVPNSESPRPLPSSPNGDDVILSNGLVSPIDAFRQQRQNSATESFQPVAAAPVPVLEDAGSGVEDGVGETSDGIDTAPEVEATGAEVEAGSEIEFEAEPAPDSGAIAEESFDSDTADLDLPATDATVAATSSPPGIESSGSAPPVVTPQEPDPLAAAPTSTSPPPSPPLLQQSSLASSHNNTPPFVPTPAGPPNRTFSLATAPPVGDIATGDVILSAPTVDLGSSEAITLTFRDAPVDEVLRLLVRRAGLNVVFNDIPADATISLDIAGSPLQEVFNSILRLNQLQAERVGQTVFVGTTLPGVQQTTMRTFRLNQSYVFETTLTAGGVNPSIGDNNADSTGEDIIVPGILDTLIAMTDTLAPLEGVELYGDGRTNAITAIGTPYQLDIIGVQISQLDVRRRQVMMDMKLMDILLGDELTLNFAGLFGSGNWVVDFATVPFASPGLGLRTIEDPPLGAPSPPGSGRVFYDSRVDVEEQFGASVEARQDTDRVKILADPKVVVSDGGFSTVTIGDEVITNIEFETDPATGVTTQTAVIGNAGVTLVVRNVRIDDNGYVTFDFSPQVSSPASQEDFAGTTLTLLSQRTLNTQQVRLRDGQTLLLTGLIQDSDRVSVHKVPLLGDIPLLGALFRRESTDSERREVVLMVTPFILRDDIAQVP